MGMDIEGILRRVLKENQEDMKKTMENENRKTQQMTDAKTQIEDTVKSNDVVLYMKGTKTMPQCGFSQRVAGVLNYMGVDYADVNVLADDAIRQGIKDYSDWPTIPQLYVKGEFVGGCDIVKDEGLVEYLNTGRGSIRMRARCEQTTVQHGKRATRPACVFTNLPLYISTEQVGQQIKAAVEAGKIDPLVSETYDIEHAHEAIEVPR